MACLTHTSDSTFMRGELLNHGIYAASMIDLMVHTWNGVGKLLGFGPWIDQRQPIKPLINGDS